MYLLNIKNLNEENIRKIISFYLLCALPIAFIVGNLLLEIIASLIIFTFIFDQYIKKVKINFKEIWFPVIFISYITINTYFKTHDIELTLKSLFYCRFIILIFAIQWILDTNLKVEIFFKFFVIIIFFFLFDLIFQFIFKFNLIGISASESYIKGMHLKIFEGKINRYSGFFGDELIAGSFLSKFFLITIFYFLNIQKNKLISIFYIILFTFGIFISGERASLLIFLLSLFLLILLFDKKTKIIISVFIILFVSIILNFKNTEIVKRYTQDEPFNIILNYTDKDIKEYLGSLKNTNHGKLFVTSVGMILKSPVTGYGLKGFRNNCDQYNKKYFNDINGSCSTHPHNYYLDILIDHGIIGMILLFCLIFKLIHNNFKELNKLNKIFLIYLAITFWPLITAGSFFTNWISFTIWLNIGLFLSLSNLNQKNYLKAKL